jgi:hypothetical protein
MAGCDYMLLWIAIIMRPSRNPTLWAVVLSRRTILLGVVTYVFYEWPLWLRNLVLSDEGRVVYAYPSIDINPASFVMQELIILGFCLLLSVIWRQWAAYLVLAQSDDPADHDGYIAVLTDPQAAISFREIFARWLSCSGLLALAFAGLTAFYWDLVGNIMTNDICFRRFSFICCGG